MIVEKTASTKRDVRQDFDNSRRAQDDKIDVLEDVDDTRV
jgi:hypothetical protein